MKFDGFLIGLILAVALAIVYPAPGASGGVLHMDLASKYGVAVVFFLYGLTLAPEKMRAGLARWPAHIVIQTSTFVSFPVLMLLAAPFVADALPAAIWIGFLYVAALPSTVSSSVAMTSLARGDVPVAIFNASLSSLIGVFATPALMAWFIASEGGSMDLGGVILKIMALVLAPLAAGQIARRWLMGWATRNAGYIKLADRAVILAIVYNTFCDSMMSGIWTQVEPLVLAEVLVGSVALFFLVYGLILLTCRLLGFNREETIASVFCGSKKSLATGVPLAPVIFAGMADVGLIIAPIMLYHFMQLVIVSVIAARYGRDHA